MRRRDCLCKPFFHEEGRHLYTLLTSLSILAACYSHTQHRAGSRNNTTIECSKSIAGSPVWQGNQYSRILTLGTMSDSCRHRLSKQVEEQRQFSYTEHLVLVARQINRGRLESYVLACTLRMTASTAPLNTSHAIGMGIPAFDRSDKHRPVLGRSL